MPADAWTEAARMLTAGTIVAGAVAPLWLLAVWVARRNREPILPPWNPWRVPWSGLEVFIAFAVVGVVIPVGAAQLPLPAPVRNLLAVPVQLGFLAIAARHSYPAWNPLRCERGRPSSG